MSKEELKNRIANSLQQLDVEQLKSTYSLIKDLIQQQKHSLSSSDKQIIDSKISIGIQQLENNEGKDFGIFLNELQGEYGKKK